MEKGLGVGVNHSGECPKWTKTPYELRNGYVVCTISQYQVGGLHGTRLGWEVGSKAFHKDQVRNNGRDPVSPILKAKTQGQKHSEAFNDHQKGVRPFRSGSTAEEIYKTS